MQERLRVAGPALIGLISEATLSDQVTEPTPNGLVTEATLVGLIAERTNVKGLRHPDDGGVGRDPRGSGEPTRLGGRQGRRGESRHRERESG
jgi:hypothetical protein